MRLLGHAGLRRVLAHHRVGGADITFDEDDEDDIRDVFPSRRRRKAKCQKNGYPPIPSEEGQRLMDGGTFGTSEYYRDRRMKKKTKLLRKLMSRELGADRNQSTRATSVISQVGIMREVAKRIADSNRIRYLLQTPILSFTTTLDVIRDNFPRTATSFSLAPRILKFECTTRQTLIIGSIIKP